MRCLSPFTNYSVPIFKADERVVMDVRGMGTYVTEGETILAEFRQTGLMDHEVDLALSKFNFSGLPEGVNPITRVGVFDTEQFCLDRYPDEARREEMQAQIDQRLRALQERFSTHFIIVEEPKAPKPWGSYDKDSAEDILKLQERLEIDPTVVRRYEEENQGREEIVSKMLELEVQRVPEDEDIEVRV